MINPIKNIVQGVMSTNIATYNTTILKTLSLFIITLLSVFVTYTLITPTTVFVSVLLSGILSIILLLLTPKYLSYKQIAFPIALLEGIGIGAITFMIEQKVPGVGIKAVLATMLSFVIVYALYALKIIKVTPTLIKATTYGLYTALIGIFAILILSLFKVIVLTSLILNVIFGFTLLLGLSCLIINFQEVFKAVENKVHKDEEWGLAISLLISIILIYESFLRLFGINLNID